MSIFDELTKFQRELHDMNDKLDRVIDLLEQLLEVQQGAGKPRTTYWCTVGPGWSGCDCVGEAGEDDGTE